MKIPSDAQAAVLSCVQEHDREGIHTYANIAEHRGSKVALYAPRTAHELGPGAIPPSILLPQPSTVDVLMRPANLAHPRIASLDACERAGWLDLSARQQIDTPCLGVAWRASGDPWTVVLNVVELTEDGTIALGAWRKRRLARPFERPVLEGADRDLVELAERANRLGFAVLPVTEQAKKNARRLARSPFACRGRGAGVGTRSLEPTAMGVVEVNPDAADQIGAVA